MLHICVFFANDGREWGNYLVSLLQSKALELQVLTFDVSKFHDGQNQGEDYKTALLKLLLVTPEFLQYFNEPFPEWFPSPKNKTLNILSVLCAVEATQLPKEIRSLDWRIVSLDDSDTGIRKLIKDIAKAVDECEEPQTAPVKAPTPTPRPRQFPSKATPKQTSSGDTGLAIPTRSKFPITRVMPKKVTFPGEELVIIFGEPLGNEDNIEVDIGGTRISTKALNPYTYVINAPGGLEGKVQMYIYRGTEKLNSYPLSFEPLDLSGFTYSSMLAQALQLPPNDNEALDKKLLEMFESTVPGGSFEGLFSSSLSTTEELTEKSDKRLPTVLHFAAYNGLKELSCRLLEVPGSLLAYRVENCDGLDPAQLADYSGNAELAEYLRNYVETKVTVDMVDNMYVTMSGHSLLYANTKPGANEDIYEKYDEYALMSPGPVNIGPDSRPILPSRSSSEKSRQKESRLESLPKSASMPREGFCFGDETPSPGTVGSRSLEELKQINTLVSRKKFSLETAEELFEAWKMRYSNAPASFIQRQKALEDLRETFRATLETAEVSKEKSEMGRFLNRVRSSRKKVSGKKLGYGARGINVISSPIYESTAEEGQEDHEIYSEVDSDRDSYRSSYSSTSGGSRGSRTSTESSGLGSSWEDCGAPHDTYGKRSLIGKKQKSRLSRREKVLQDPASLSVRQAPSIPLPRPPRRHPMPPPPRS